MSALSFPASIIRCYRSAALSTAGGGALTTIGWDAESATPVKTRITHSTSSSNELVTIVDDGIYEVHLHVNVAGGIALASCTGEIQIDTVPRARFVGPANTSAGVVVLRDLVALTSGQALRVQVASNVTADLVVGEAGCYFALRRVR